MSSDQKDWVSRGGALTRHLSRHGFVTVRVLAEGVALPWADEAYAFGAGRHRVWTREVVLSVDGMPCVVAHSVTALHDSNSVWKAMRTLRTRPLADLLYHDRSVRRSFLVSRRTRHRGDMLVALIDNAAVADGDPALSRPRRKTAVPLVPSVPLRRAAAHPPCYVARRSLFERRGKALIITECFLPAFWDLLADVRVPTTRNALIAASDVVATATSVTPLSLDGPNAV